MNTILPQLTPSFDPVPEMLMGYVSVRGKASAFGHKTRKWPTTSKSFHATSRDRKSVLRDLEKNGFKVIEESRLGFSVAAPPAAFEFLTGGKIEMKERLMAADAGCERYVTHVDITGAGQPDEICVGSVKSKKLPVDGVIIETPKATHQVWPPPQPPSSSKIHLKLPMDVARVLGASPAHSSGLIGKDVTVAMVDTGQYQHPFFAANGYRVNVPVAMVPGTNPAHDPAGHGTGQSANIFAVAPV